MLQFTAGVSTPTSPPKLSGRVDMATLFHANCLEFLKKVLTMVAFSIFAHIHMVMCPMKKVDATISNGLESLFDFSFK